MLHASIPLFTPLHNSEAITMIPVLQNETLRHRERLSKMLQVTQLLSPNATSGLSTFRVWVLGHPNTMCLHETEGKGQGM